MKLIREEKGQTLVLTAFLMCILLGFTALAIDVGVLLRAQRRVQTAADAAAIAAGLEYYYHGGAKTTSAAQAAAAQNGVTDATQVQVNTPPNNGWHRANGYIEVIINQPNATTFMATFANLMGSVSPGSSSSNYNKVSVAARAVVGIVPGQSCVYILDTKNAGALSIQGGATVNSPNCTWTVNSSSPAALCITGNNALANINTPGILVVNPQGTDKNCNKIYPGASTTGSTSSDPFANILSFPDPTNNKVCDSSNTITQASVSALPTGITYKSSTVGGVDNSSGTLSYNVLCFDAGKDSSGKPIATQISGVWGGTGTGQNNNLYIFKDGMALTGATTFNGTVDLNNGAFCQGGLKSNGSCQFNSTIQSFTINPPANGDGLTPPDNSAYAWNGMAFIMPSSNTYPSCDSSYGGPAYSASGTPNSCLQMQFGSNSGSFNGYIYAPTAALALQDNGGATLVGGLIVDALDDKSSSLTITNYAYAHPESPLNKVSLVE